MRVRLYVCACMCVMMALRLPEELWLHVLSFLPWRDKLSVRATCRHLRRLLDEAPPLWRGLCLVLRHWSLYDEGFWSSLASRRLRRAVLRGGGGEQLRLLARRLPELSALGLADWRDAAAPGRLRRFGGLRRLSLASWRVPLSSAAFLPPLRQRLTQLSVCGVPLAVAPAAFLAAVSQLERLTSLLLHHDGQLRLEPDALAATLRTLPVLRHLSWQMISYKTLPENFFSPAPSTELVRLSSLELLNYDALVTPLTLRPLSRLLSLSVSHLYSVPGSTCHLRAWLSALPCLTHLSVIGGHPLGMYVELLPPSLSSLTLNVEMEMEDLLAVARRLPELQHLHLEPWGSTHSMVRLLPQLFPQLRTLRIRHHGVSDADFLRLRELPVLLTLEVLDPFHRPVEGSDVVLERPGPRLLRLAGELQRQTGQRVRVVLAPPTDALACHCA